MFRSLAAGPTMGKTSLPFEHIVGPVSAQVNDLQVKQANPKSGFAPAAQLAIGRVTSEADHAPSYARLLLKHPHFTH